MIRDASVRLWARGLATKAPARPVAPPRSAAGGPAPSPDADLARAERFGHRFLSAPQGDAGARLPAHTPAIPGSAAGAGPPLLAGGVIQRVKGSEYQLANYRKSSKFRFARWRRRNQKGFATKGKAGINFFTVKYKKGGKAYYLTTRSVPSTNASSFRLAAGHSEERFKLLRGKFETKHSLSSSDLQWGATEREPCGEGVGMAKCRTTLGGMGIPKNKVFYGFRYPDREDMRTSPTQTASELNEEASKERAKHNAAMEKDVGWLGGGYESDPPSENEADVVDEYESDYGEKPAERRPRPVKKLAGAFRKGWKKP